jgi:hypothetical protein
MKLAKMETMYPNRRLWQCIIISIATWLDRILFGRGGR